VSSYHHFLPLPTTVWELIESRRVVSRVLLFDLLICKFIRTQRSSSTGPWVGWLQYSPDVGDTYVDFLAKIYVFRNMSLFDHWNPEEAAKHVSAGNSRDPPSPFLYHCLQRCTYSSWRPALVRTHTINCQGSKQNETNKLHVCPCGATNRLNGPWASVEALAAQYDHALEAKLAGETRDQIKKEVFLASRNFVFLKQQLAN
jgi:hypothetical protein